MIDFCAQRVTIALLITGERHDVVPCLLTELQVAMTKRTTGEYENVVAGGENVPAFLPYALPPGDPAFAMSENLLRIGTELGDDR